MRHVVTLRRADRSGPELRIARHAGVVTKGRKVWHVQLEERRYCVELTAQPQMDSGYLYSNKAG